MTLTHLGTIFGHLTADLWHGGITTDLPMNQTRIRCGRLLRQRFAYFAWSRFNLGVSQRCGNSRRCKIKPNPAKFADSPREITSGGGAASGAGSISHYYDRLGRLRLRVERDRPVPGPDPVVGEEPLVEGGGGITWYTNSITEYIYDGWRVIQERDGSN